MDISPQENPSERPQEQESFLATFGIKTAIARTLLGGILVLIFLCAILSFLIMPPSDFPVGKPVIVKDGMSVGQVSYLLKEEHYIRSRVGFEFCVLTIGGEKGVHSGEYMFKEPTSLCLLAMRFARGITGVPAVRVTIPEGSSNKEVAAIAKKNLPQFNANTFLEAAKQYEGELFPETYFFLPTATSADVLAMMRNEFSKNIKTLEPEIQKTGHAEQEIIIMASLLEKEARTEADQKIVSGILWKRISIKMALQVDAPFLYALGKTSAELTVADLKTDSPYNTYTRRGLPVGPIGNPGLAALRAAIAPTKSDYLYYLSDTEGGMHYAKTFEEHKANKVKYLSR